MVLDELFEFGDALGVGADPLLVAIGLALEFVVAADGFVDGALDFG